ncbi:MAG TPA: lipoyl(octanoyl) transferase LipB [Solirubrobacteraceae bacterium]|jgi:lipoyl(octanoyl) transferase|nr:lipoyl(octanoyl) transferase LipB [Solirubrobacteraceae bacterium]
MAGVRPTHDDSPLDELLVSNLGTIPYREALAIQAAVQARRQADEQPDTLLLLEHPPVYTRGRRAGDGELSLGEGFYRAHDIEIVPTDRGGKVTYHGPGQLVGYPIMRVSDIGFHLRTMEAAIVAALAEYGIDARSRCAEGIDYTGVWVADRKIASIGVHVSRGVSTHGFALNVCNDLTPFTWIVPCGLPGVTMTSVTQELGHDPDGGLDAFSELVAQSFCTAHGRPLLAASPESVGVLHSAGLTLVGGV